MLKWYQYINTDMLVRITEVVVNRYVFYHCCFYFIIKQSKNNIFNILH